MKTIRKVLYFVFFVLVIFYVDSGAWYLYSQDKITEETNLPYIREKIQIPRYQLYDSLRRFTSTTHTRYGDVFFCEMAMLDRKKYISTEEKDRRETGYYLLRERMGMDLGATDVEGEYIAFYSDLHDKDIFPLPGALFYRDKSGRAIGYDAFLVPKKYYPEGVTVRYDTFIIPYIPEKKDCRKSYLWGYFSADRIEKDKEGKLRVKITYEPQRIGEVDGDDTKTNWYSKGDILQFFPRKDFEQDDYGNRRYSWPNKAKKVNAESFGLRLVNIVPRDPYPMRGVGDKKKGRLIGWIEIDSQVIPLDKNGKPIKQKNK
ncbi:MAG: hypothetical protein LBC74_02830 [Planctomycetaceae bacterium]|jgi:hypothetical protein|nr:hypothetical protein [Planctomycetaceae bacterium]